MPVAALKLKPETVARLRRLKRGMTLALLGIAAISLVVWFVYASVVANRSDLVSNQAINALASHKITFDMTGGNTIDAGEQIVIDLGEDSGGFQIAGATAAAKDIDLRDGTQRNIGYVGVGAPDCTGLGGVNDMAVGINDAAGIVTFLACPGFVSSTSSSVVIALGSNSTKPSAADIITNPGAAGAVRIYLTDAAGECTSLGDLCHIDVPIVDSNQVTINATVSGAPPPPPPPQDNVPPIITNIRCTDITKSSITFRFDTNETGSTEVNYGLTTSYGLNYSDPSLVLFHAAPANGLQEATTYHYQVRSMDSANNLSAWSADQTCATIDETPPVISGVSCTPGLNDLTIAWTTDEPATSFVDYEVDPFLAPYASTGGSASPLATGHSVQLTGLSADTTYHYRARSGDASGNEAFTADATCKTSAPPKPCVTCAQLTYDLYIVNPDTTERHLGTAWVLEEDLGGGKWRYSYEDKTLAPGDPENDHDDVVMELDRSNCDQLVVSFISNDATWDHQARLKVFVDGVEQSDTLVESSTKAAIGTSVTVNARDLVGQRCAGPPVISGITVTDITKVGARVSWMTDIPSTSYVDYGLTAGYGSTSGMASPLTIYHSVQLSSLSPTTLYHFRVRSADIDGASASSADNTFTTLENIPPVISNIQVTNITTTSARITWTTDENSTSRVDYGLTSAYGSVQSSASLVTAHSIDLAGLSPDTTYHFKVSSTDAAANTGASGDLTFKTLKPPPPVISNIRVTNITQTSGRVEWDTDVLATSTVEWGLDATYGNSKTVAGTATAHAVPLSGLTKGTLYHYRVKSTGPYAQTTTSGDNTFTTLADTVAPANVTGLTAVAGDSRVDLSWNNPTDADFVGVVLVRRTDRFPTGPTDGTVRYTGPVETFADTTVINDNTYYYGVFAYDDAVPPNYSSGAVASATPRGPVDTTPPAPPNPFTATPGDGQIQLDWTNPSDADLAGVYIVRKSLTCPTSRTDGTVVYDGLGTSKLDAGLSNGTLYCYRAWAYDGVPNWSTGVNASATPLAPPDTTPPGPVTSLTAVAGDSIIQLIWTNPSDADWAGTRVLRQTGGYPTGPTDGTIVFDGAGDSKLDTGLTNGTTYYYAAYAYDSSLNYASPAQAEATPTGGTPPPPPPTCTDSDGGRVYSVYGVVTDSTSNSYDDKCADGKKVKEYYCDGGQAKSEVVDCGDGYRCSAGKCVVETVSPPTTICGNGLCEGSENSINCPADCPITPPTPPTPPTQPEGPSVEDWQHIVASDLIFRSTKGRILLRQTGVGTVQAYRNMTVSVIVPDADLAKPVATAFVNFSGSSYQMKKTGEGYEATLVMPSSLGDKPLEVVVNYDDDTNDKVPATMRLVDPGQVYETTGNHDSGLTGARVTLLYDTGGGNFGLWPAASYGQQNPQVAGQDGYYRFIVPEGTYKVQAELDKYGGKTTLAFSITTENVITSRIKLIKEPEKKIIEELTNPDSTVAEKVSGAAQAVGQQAAVTAQQTVDTVREAIGNETVERQAQSVAAPAAAAVAVANVVTVGTTTAAGIPYLMYLTSFLAHPTLLFARRRRKKWGVVYNSLSKVPVDLAIVRLLDAKSNRVLRSSVTDKEGRYVFIARAGDYRLTVTKTGYVFPTAYLRGQKEDGQYVDLYHGEDLKASDNSAITANIPVDPLAAEKTPRQVVWAGIARRFQRSLGLLSILAMIVVTVISPTTLMFFLLAGNILTYAVFRRMSVSAKPKNWGIVYDSLTGKPLRNAIARVFESRYNKLLETQVTDSKGRYSFLVGRNVYFVTFEKPGYQKQQKGPVDLIKAKEGVLAVDVALQPSAQQGGGAKADKKPGEDGQPPTEPSEPASLPPRRPIPPPPGAAPAAGQPAAVPPAPATPAPAPPEPKAEAPVAKPEVQPAAEQEKKPDSGPKVPWELQMLQKMKPPQPPAKPEPPAPEQKPPADQPPAEKTSETPPAPSSQEKTE